MAKNKEKKKKERERRVAKKKIAAALNKAQEKKTKEPQKSVPGRTKLTTAAVSKPNNIPTNKKSPFTQRRSVG